MMTGDWLGTFAWLFAIGAGLLLCWLAVGAWRLLHGRPDFGEGGWR